MSKLEETIEKQMIMMKINYSRKNDDCMIPIPPPYPWAPNSKRNHKVDFRIETNNNKYIYIEVKGWMTIYAMAKIMWLTNNVDNYYILQASEIDWDVNKISILSQKDKINCSSNIELQLIEIKKLLDQKNIINTIRNLNIKRIRSYIKLRILEYKHWNGKWY